MPLQLYATKGPLINQIFSVRDGIRIGRSSKENHIILDDVKISSKHAQILANDKGEFEIHDLNSRNGIWVNDEKKQKIVLFAGLRLALGDSVFEVVEKNEVLNDFVDHAALTATRPLQKSTPDAFRIFGNKSKIIDRNNENQKAPNQKQSLFKGPRTKVLVPEKWYESLARLLEDHMDILIDNYGSYDGESATAQELQTHPQQDSRPLLYCFSKPLELAFQTGLQAGQKKVLSYGPRQAGPKSIDIPILEPEISNPAFELHPHEKGVEFRTEIPHKVKFNGKPLKETLIQPGDQIIVKGTLIKLNYLD